MNSLIVLGDGNVHVAQKIVCVAGSNSRQVNIRCFCESWWPALWSVTTNSLGILKAAWFWLVKVPGMKKPAVGVASVAEAHFSAAYWPVSLNDMALTLAGFPIAAMV